MNNVIEVILREVKDIKKEKFTKTEIIDLLSYYLRKPHQPKLESNDIVIDPEIYLVTVGEKKFSNLPPKIFNLLYYFISNKNKYLSREQILLNVWGYDNIGERTVDVHVKKLRTILSGNHIKTQRNFGYIWLEK